LPVPRWSFASRLAVGAIAAAAAAGVIWTARPPRGPSGSAGDHRNWLPAITDTRLTREGAAGEADHYLVEGLAAYARRDVEAAVRNLTATRAAGPLESMRRAYLGSALVWSDRPAEAAALLATVPIETLPEPWQSEARWTLWIAWRAAGDPARADSLLEVLSREPGEVGDRARALGDAK
jgi:hypothetical protein